MIDQPSRADYGIDAPDAVRNMLLGGVLAVAAGIVSRRNSSLQRSMPGALIPYGAIGGGIILLLSGGLISATSLITKKIVYKQLIASLNLRGDEQMLDVGCGRGMLMIEAAKHLPKGQITGIDLWVVGDQSGNSPESTLQNAQAEGVRDRIRVETGDMRQMPFPDASFDAICSSIAIHNIHDRNGCAQAIREIARVTKPGGRVALLDIAYTVLYADTLRDLGWQVQRSEPQILMYPPPRIVYGQKPM